MTRVNEDEYYGFLIGCMVQHEIAWNWQMTPCAFDDYWRWIEIMAQRMDDLILDAHGCLDADL